jgi:ABC-type Mn2+/Zn2+ transport system permease subunit
MGISLSVFFGLGLVLLTSPRSARLTPAGWILPVSAGSRPAAVRCVSWQPRRVAWLCLRILEEFMLISFDREYAAALAAVSLLDLLLTSLW